MADAGKQAKDMSDSELAELVEITVRQFLKEEGGAEDALTLALDEELGAHFDSFLIMELVVHLEGRFGVNINTSNVGPQDIRTIASICRLAAKAVREASQA
jgi:acyl carrier protein